MKLAVKRAKLWEAPSDGSHHASREAVIVYERELLINRISSTECLGVGECLRDLFDPHLASKTSKLRADILEFASLLRPPRAKRGSKTAAGQSAANPSHASSMEPSTASFVENKGSALGANEDDEPLSPEELLANDLAGAGESEYGPDYKPLSSVDARPPAGIGYQYYGSRVGGSKRK